MEEEVDRWGNIQEQRSALSCYEPMISVILPMISAILSTVGATHSSPLRFTGNLQNEDHSNRRCLMEWPEKWNDWVGKGTMLARCLCLQSGCLIQSWLHPILSHDLVQVTINKKTYHPSLICKRTITCTHISEGWLCRWKEISYVEHLIQSLALGNL